MTTRMMMLLALKMRTRMKMGMTKTSRKMILERDLGAVRQACLRRMTTDFWPRRI
jgi:hypothetical protein